MIETLIFKPGHGFNAVIENEDGELIATINVYGSQRQKYYGQLFAASNILLETCQRVLNLLDEQYGPETTGSDDARPLLRSAIKAAPRPALVIDTP